MRRVMGVVVLLVLSSTVAFAVGVKKAKYIGGTLTDVADGLEGVMPGSR